MERKPRAAAKLAQLALPCPGLLCSGPYGARVRPNRKCELRQSLAMLADVDEALSNCPT